MKNIKPAALEKLISGVLAGTMILMPVFFLLFRCINDDATFVYSMQLSLLCITGLAAILLIALCSFNSIRHYKLSFADIIAIALFVTAVISCIFTTDKEKLSINNSFVGGALSSEGLLALTAYYLIFEAASFITDTKRKVKTLILCIAPAVVFTIFGFLQSFDLEVFGTSAVSAVFNENYIFSAYCVLAFGICLGLLLCVKTPWVKIASAVLCALVLAVNLLTNTTSGVFATVIMLTVALVLELIACFIKKGKDRFNGLLLAVAAILLSIGVAVITNALSGGKVFLIWKELGIKNALNYKFGIDLPWLWNQLLDSYKNHSEFWLHGVGIDNFRAGSGQYYFTKAHNEFIQVMFTEGLTALAAYIILYITVFIKAVAAFIKNAAGKAENTAASAVLLAFVGYVAQSYFNISSIDVAPLFWIVCGLACTRRFADSKPVVTDEVSARLDGIKSQIDEINEQA